MIRPLVMATVTAAALAVPAQAAPPSTNLVYTVTASTAHPALTATCVFRPDRWTADYGPTYVDGYAVAAGPGQVTTIRCLVYSWDNLVGDFSGAGGNVALIANERAGFVASSPNITVCVEASTYSTIVTDSSADIGDCDTP